MADIDNEVYFHFNKIWVIESLPGEEQQTGTILFKDFLNRKKEQMPGLHVELVKINDLSELIILLRKIRKDVADELHLPFLHFEIHGNKSGLVLASGESIAWFELANLIRLINIETRNNVMVTTAVCFGGYAFMEIDPNLPAPFAGIIGPFTEVYVADIEAGFNEFFDILLGGGGFQNALSALNQYGAEEAKFQFIPALNLFNTIWNNITKQYDDPVYMRDKIFLQTYRGVNAPGNRKTMQEVKAFMVDRYMNKREEMKNEVLDVFLMRNLPAHSFNDVNR